MGGACAGKKKRCGETESADRRSNRERTGCDRIGTCGHGCHTAGGKKIKEAGIKLVLIDSGLAEDVADCMVSTDNYEAGRKLGEFVASISSTDEKIGIVSHVEGSSTAKDRGKKRYSGSTERK